MGRVPSVEKPRHIDLTIPGGAPIVGIPDDCIQALRRYQDEARVTHLVMGMHLPGLALGRMSALNYLLRKSYRTLVDEETVSTKRAEFR